MELPIACTLSETAMASRRGRWLDLAVSVIEKVPTSRGVVLRYRRDPDVVAELDELVALERECCAFASWAVRDLGTSEGVELRVEAEGEGAAAVRSMFEVI